MDQRLALPLLLLATALALTGGVGEALRGEDNSFVVEPRGPAAGAWTALTMTGKHGASPGLNWTDPSVDVAGFALVAEDLDEAPGRRVFWAVWGIRGGARDIEPGLPRDVEAGPPDAPLYQAIAWDGRPGFRPPSLGTTARHRLSFTLFALGEPLDLSSGAQAEDVRRAANAVEVDRARWTIGGGW